MMFDAIAHFHEQLRYDPELVHADRLAARRHLIVAGMGGSHLAAGLLGIADPGRRILIHRDYGIPMLDPKERDDYLFVASSYSGNTEETIDAFLAAGKASMHRAVICVGGRLLDLATSESVPHIQMPQTGIQPRSALGYSVKALLTLIGDVDALTTLTALSRTLDPMLYEAEGKILADELFGRVPIIYASTRNFPIAYNWKIKFNETGKIPAFVNAVPELNHNEMTGFDVQEASKNLSDNFSFLILDDPSDDPRIRMRMQIIAELYRDRGFPVRIIPITGASPYEKIFSSLILADWSAYHTATKYGLEPEQVPMVETFKKMISERS